jgi:hypothetical protein
MRSLECHPTFTHIQVVSITMFMGYSLARRLLNLKGQRSVIIAYTSQNQMVHINSHPAIPLRWEYSICILQFDHQEQK